MDALLAYFRNESNPSTIPPIGLRLENVCIIWPVLGSFNIAFYIILTLCSKYVKAVLAIDPLAIITGNKKWRAAVLCTGTIY